MSETESTEAAQAEEFEIEPIEAGVGYEFEVRSAHRTPDAVAERVAEFEAAGVDLLLLQCSPQLEEMEIFSDSVIR